MPTKKVCLDCEQPIQGRSDKKFCDDNCRTNFHNQQKQHEEKILRQINSILKRNRTILLRLSAGKEVEVPTKVLIEANFNFHFCTHQQHINQQRWPVVYDVAYYKVDDSHTQIKQIVSEKISSKARVWNLCAD